MGNKKKFSSLKNFSRLLFGAILVIIILFVYLKFDTFLDGREKGRLEAALETQKLELEEITNYTGYNTLLGVQELNKKKVNLPRSKHIKQIFRILQDLKELTEGKNSTIILSDFNVSLDSIQLNGKVTTLRALYYNAPGGGFKSLLDRFQELDFIRNLEIKNYEKSDEKYFDFVLNANVIINDTK